MSEERSRILKLLEDGKINADQAARLIQALGAEAVREPPEPPRFSLRRQRRILAAELDRIPDIVAEAVSSAVRSGFDRSDSTRTDFPGKNSLFLKSVSGDVEVSGWDEDRVRLDGLGTMVRVRERDDQVMVRSISGDLSGRVPRESRLELVSVSGDVKVSGTRGKFTLKSVSGDIVLEDVHGSIGIDSVSGSIVLERVAGSISVESKSGDISLRPVGEFSGEVVSRSGDIKLELGPDADVVLDMECEEEGEISVEAGSDHEVLEEAERSMRVKFGKGSRVLRLRTRRADIRVRVAAEE
ncbi:MAG: DUF4097 family beta strand repeat-containing protein [candidate division WOR-3 bacterium]